METKTKTIAIFASGKAVITTAILGIAIVAFQTILNLTRSFSVGIIAMVLCICIFATTLYLYELSNKKILKTYNHLVQIYDFNWADNTRLIVSKWAISIVVTIVILLHYIGFVIAPFIIIIPILFGICFVFLARNECKTLKNMTTYFIYGYLCGIGSVICGMLISYLITIFGVLWIFGLLFTDAVFSGFYTYLDLHEWEHEQQIKAEQQAKIIDEIKVDDKIGVP